MSAPTFSVVLNHAPFVHERRPWLETMRRELEPGASELWVHDTDYRQGGAVGKKDRVDFTLAQWRWSERTLATHHLFCTDDLTLAPSFWPIVRAMVEAAPHDVIGLLSNHPKAPELVGRRRFYATNSWVVGPCYVVPRMLLRELLEWPGTYRKDAEGLGWSDDSTLNEWITFDGPGRALHPIPTPIRHDRMLSTWSHTGHGDDYSHERVPWDDFPDLGDMTSPYFWHDLGGPEGAPLLQLP